MNIHVSDELYASDDILDEMADELEKEDFSVYNANSPEVIEAYLKHSPKTRISYGEISFAVPDPVLEVLYNISTSSQEEADVY